MRINGKTKICQNCRFWSQMCAQSIGLAPMEALCLARGGPKNSKFVVGNYSCYGYKPNDLGFVDEPPDYGKVICKRYIELEGTNALHAATKDLR